MSGGLIATAELVFGRPTLHRLGENVQLENSKSISLVRIMGFSLEGFSPGYLKTSGCWQDHQHWALLVGN